MNIITLAFDMTKAVNIFIQKVKKFFYHVMLLGYRCPKCHSQLNMVAESKCQCNSCEYEFDPTIAFQRCSACGGVPILRVRRYYCQQCHSEITSRFLFDSLAFSSEYFKLKMAESRLRKKDLRERVYRMLAESRSGTLKLETVELDSAPGLVTALDHLTQGLEESVQVELRAQFDLKRYQDHIKHYSVNIVTYSNGVGRTAGNSPGVLGGLFPGQWFTGPIFSAEI